MRKGCVMQGTAAGWYPDPSGSGDQRWWDGSQWTAHRQPSPPPPNPAPVASASGQVPQTGNQPTVRIGHDFEHQQSPYGSHPPDRQWNSPQFFRPATGFSKQAKVLLSVAAGILAIVVAIAVSATSGKSQQSVAQNRCKEHVRDRLVSPSTTRFVGELTTKPSQFDGGYDKAHFSVQAGGVPADSITQVWAVSGSFDTQNRSGAMVRGSFSCKAFFIGDEFIATTVSVNGK